MNFFKKLFSREPKKITLKSIELKDWLYEVSQEALSATNKNINKKFSEIEELKKDLKLKFLELEEQELVNPNIPEREKHIMQGNRIHYIQKARAFVDEIKEPEFNYLEIQDFCTAFNDKLKDFDSATSKPYFILTNFFDKDMKDIAFSIKKIEDNTIELSNIIKGDKIRQYKALLLKIRELNEAALASDNLTKELKELTAALKNSEERKLRFQEKQVSLKHSRDYAEYNNLEQERNEIEESITKLNSKLNNTFKAIDKPLKKFMHGALKKDLIQDYLSNPLMALEKDKNYEILKILEKIEQETKKGHLEIKDKQVSKIEKQMQIITKPFLTETKKEFIALKNKKHEITRRKDRLSVMMDYKEVQYQLSHVNDKLNEIKEKISHKQTLLENQQQEQKIKHLESSLTEFTGYDVGIE